MAMTFAKWNEPFEILPLTDGRIRAFCIITFDATAVGGITGTTYDPTDHLTTAPFGLGACVAGADPKTVFGLPYIEQIEFSAGSSDAQAESAAATSNTGRVKFEWVESGQYIKIKTTGHGDADPVVLQNELELDTTAGALSALRIRCALVGKRH